MEGLLFAFHLKGTALDWRLHFLLVLVVFLGAGTTLAEVAHPHAVLLSTLRAQLVLLQGIWFVQIAEILYRGTPCPEFPGSCCGQQLGRAGRLRQAEPPLSSCCLAWSAA